MIKFEIMKTMSPERRRVIAALDDQKAYAAAQIADISLEMKVTTDSKTRGNFRRNLWEFQRNHLPESPDEFVKYPRQGSIPGWYGWRWKEAAGISGE